MKRIILANQKGFALVDDEDFERVNQFKWHIKNDPRNSYALHTFHNGYKYINGIKKQIFGSITMHKFILFIKPGVMIDHIDNNGLNNQKSNLRYASALQNTIHSRPNKGRKYKGVYLEEIDKKGQQVYRARIMINGKNENIGRFHSFKSALEAYNKRAKEVYGEFAWLNFL